jgi:hypothetical protein
MVKKAGAALAVKEVVDRVRESRRPKRSKIAQLGPKFLIVGLIGATAYIVKSGRLDGLLGRGGSPEPVAYPTQPSVGVREGSTEGDTRVLEGSPS